MMSCVAKTLTSVLGIDKTVEAPRVWWLRLSPSVFTWKGVRLWLSKIPRSTIVWLRDHHGLFRAVICETSSSLALRSRSIRIDCSQRPVLVACGFTEVEGFLQLDN